MRASTLKFFAVVCVALVTLITLITFIPDYSSVSTSADDNSNSATYSYDKIKTNDDRIGFLSQFGWKVKPEVVENVEITVPSTFDKIFVGYNEIQKNGTKQVAWFWNYNFLLYKEFVQSATQTHFLC